MALALDCLFVLVAIGVHHYALPKRPPPILGIWQYSLVYDCLVIPCMMALPVTGFILRCAASSLVGKKNDGKILAILLVGMLVVGASVPVRSKSKERANRVKCASNLRLVGQAIDRFARQHEGRPPQQLAELLTDEDLMPDAFICPSSSDEKATGDTAAALVEDFARSDHCSYVYCGRGAGSQKPEYILAHDLPRNHEGDGINVLYGDGHVEWLSRQSIGHVLAELAAGHNPPRPVSATRPSHQ